MESCPGIPNYIDHPKMRRPNEFEREMLMAIGHGADATMYFQWRKGRGGAEKFHGAVVGHDGSNETRCFQSVAEYGKRLPRLDEVVESHRHQEIAVCFDFESNWAMKQCSIGGDDPKQYQPAVQTWYTALWRQNMDLAVIDSKADFSPYKLLFFPMLFQFDEDFLTRLDVFVRAGGTAVVGYFSGYVDVNSCCFDGGNPGGRAGRKLFGIWNEDFDGLAPDVSQSICWNGRSFKVMDYAEFMHLEGAEALAAYECDFFRGTPAVTCHNVGKGKLYYIGARTEASFYDAFFKEIATECGVKPVLENIPPEVKVSRRIGKEHIFYFFCNFSDKEVSFPLDATLVPVWKDDIQEGVLTLQPNGATVLKCLC